jgi:hypothetical protein
LRAALSGARRILHDCQAAATMFQTAKALKVFQFDGGEE